MAGGEPPRAEERGRVGKDPEPHVPVARDAWVGCATGLVAADEVVDDAPAERIGGVDRDVWDAQGVGGPARELHGLGRAAGAFGGGGRGIVPEAHRDADDVVAGVAQQERGDGTVDASAHRNRDTVPRERQAGLAEAGGVPLLERPRDGVGDDFRAVPAVHGEAAEGEVEVVGRERERLVEGRAGQGLAGRAGRRGGGAAPEYQEARVDDPLAPDSKLDAGDVAAGRAPRFADRVGGVHPPGADGRREVAHGWHWIRRHESEATTGSLGPVAKTPGPRRAAPVARTRSAARCGVPGTLDGDGHAPACRGGQVTGPA